MHRRTLFAAVLASLATAPAALADGGSFGVTQGWEGVAGRNDVRYVAMPTVTGTVVAAIQRHGGRVSAFNALAGRWGTAVVTYRGNGAGLSRDGKLLVLGDAMPQPTPLRKLTQFAVLGTKRLILRKTIRLRGDFAFDALSPDARTLFLIQHVSQNDLSRYVVRAYDLRLGRLLSRPIADRRQQGWIMRGYPVARATSADGRWIYTLYRQDGGYPFVHALDSIRRTAVCIGVPWPETKSQDLLGTALLRFSNGGRTLAVRTARGRVLARLDTRTLRFVDGPEAGGIGATPIAASAGAVALLLGLLAVRRAVGSRTSRRLPAPR